MKKVIILEDDLNGNTKLSSICTAWPDELDICVAPDEKDVSVFIREEQVDLILCDLSSGYGPQLDYLASLTSIFPYIPTIAVISPGQYLPDEVHSKGVTMCLETPVNSAELRVKLHQVLDHATSGTVRGIPVHSMLQMLETEGKTCTLRVVRENGSGLIFLNSGVAVAAETEDQVNEEAMYSILAWEDTTVDIIHFNGQRPTEIEHSLISIIMEAFRLKDEREIEEHKPKDSIQAKFELKQFSTNENRVSLDVGAKIQMEFSQLDTHLVSTIVGLVDSQYVIVSTPTPFSSLRDTLQNKEKLVIKYLYMGRLCMFKTRVIEEIASPHNLLFLEYPPIIHFRELRRARRSDIYVPCVLKYGPVEALTGVLLDLSCMGCLFLTKSKDRSKLPNLDIDVEVKLNFRLPGADFNQVLNGKVKNYQKNTTELRVGVEFSDLQGHLKDSIAGYITP